MYHKKSMRIFWLSLCLLLVSGVAIIAVVQINSHKKEEQRQQGTIQDEDTRIDDRQETKPVQAEDSPVTRSDKQTVTERQVQPVGGNLSEYVYELKVVGGYLEVYYYHTKQLFFHTGIPERSLTDTQRRKLRQGKYFKDEQELYGYLESCTS